jgi:hypothetical protein
MFKDSYIKKFNVYYLFNHKTGMAYRIIRDKYTDCEYSRYSLNDIKKLYYKKNGEEIVYRSERIRERNIFKLMYCIISQVINFRKSN